MIHPYHSFNPIVENIINLGFQLSNVRKSFLFLVVLLVCITGATVSAQTVSFAVIDATTQDVYLYAANGSLLASGYNTSSTGIVLPTGTDVIFTIKPHTANPLDDPGDFLQSGFDYIQTNVIPIIVIIFLIGLLVVRRH